MLHEPRRRRSWLIFDVRPKNHRDAFVQHAVEKTCRRSDRVSLVEGSSFHRRTVWPGSTTSTRRSEMAIGGAYARSPVWFTRSVCGKSASEFGSRQRSRLRFQFTRVARSALLEPSLAEQVARANASGRHAACDVTIHRNESAESEAWCRTRHAGHWRGSSLTLG